MLLPAGAIGLYQAMDEVAKRLGQESNYRFLNEVAAWNWIWCAARDGKLSVYVQDDRGEFGQG